MRQRHPRSTLFPYTTLFLSFLVGLGLSLFSFAAGGLHLPHFMHFHLPHVHLRSEEHTSELQSLRHLVCRLLLEKKKSKGVSFGTKKIMLRCWAMNLQSTKQE